MKKVFVGMSGGVDSSVTAALLKQRGFDVVGIHLKCWNVDGCAEQDAEDARRAAETIGIPFYVLDFEKEYRDRVVKYMIDGYKSGITPNPDVMCNREIKFGLFLEKALTMGANYVATGHYVRLRERPASKLPLDRPASDLVVSRRSLSLPLAENHARSRLHTRYEAERSRFSLLVGRDKNKDQSYFLWTLTQKDLKHCLFPIGGYTKPQVRALAKKFDLPNATKKDSQGICFLGKVTLEDFLKDFIPEKRGAAVTTGGVRVGEHRGAHFYTIGQRRGIGIAGSKPYYVAGKDTKSNTLLLAEGDEDPALYRKEITVTNINVINPKKALPLDVYARVRYRQPVTRAKLEPIKGKSYKLIFREPQKFVASGQSVVIYTKSGEMLGGGIIV